MLNIWWKLSGNKPIEYLFSFFVPESFYHETLITQLVINVKRYEGKSERRGQNARNLRNTAMIHLKDLFNEIDYPVDIRSKYSFVWRFITLDIPNGNSKILAPEVYEREKEKFFQTMEEARKLAISSLREEFASMVERITERFTKGADGNAKILKNSTVESFYDYFETFKERNIFNDAELTQLVEKGQNVLANRPADTIRSNESMKDVIKEGMVEIEEVMAELLKRPRRRIVMN
jgi:hypothetical protein